jgi:hypothetical protein
MQWVMPAMHSLTRKGSMTCRREHNHQALPCSHQNLHRLCNPMYSRHACVHDSQPPHRLRMRSDLTQTTENRPPGLCFYTDSNTSAWPCTYLPALDHHQSDYSTPARACHSRCRSHEASGTKSPGGDYSGYLYRGHGWLVRWWGLFVGPP